MRKPEQIKMLDLEMDGGLIVKVNSNNLAKLIKEHNNLVEVVNQNEYTLGTLITWLDRELGEHGIKQLLEMLEKNGTSKG